MQSSIIVGYVQEILEREPFTPPPLLILKTGLIFLVLWPCLALATKNDATNLHKILIFILMQKKKIEFIPNTAKILQTCYSGYFQHA